MSTKKENMDEAYLETIHCHLLCCFDNRLCGSIDVESEKQFDRALDYPDNRP